MDHGCAVGFGFGEGSIALSPGAAPGGARQLDKTMPKGILYVETRPSSPHLEAEFQKVSNLLFDQQASMIRSIPRQNRVGK